MKKNPKITVYITSHNYGEYLEEAIQSVLRQSFQDFELLLINDGSKDNTQKIIERYKRKKNVRTFTGKNIGLPAAANIALRNAKGKYIIRLDADDIFDDHILLVLSTYLDTHKDVALVFPDYYLIDDHGGLIRHEIRTPILGNKRLQDMPANGACTMIRTSVLQKIGGYREDLRAQDGFDIWTKIIKKYSCGNVNLPLFYYRRHGSNLTSNTGKIANARQKIKKDAVMRTLKTSKPIIAIIPCREHYDIEPNLWSKKVGTLTLLDMAIRTNIASPIFDHIVVTADTPDVKRIMKKYKDPRLVFLLREKKDTAPSAHIFDTIEKVVDAFDPATTGISVMSYIQAPFTTTETLEEAVYTLLLHDADCSLAVQEITTNLYMRLPEGLVPLNNQHKVRTDLEVIYSDARASFATKNSNVKKPDLPHQMGNQIVYFHINPGENFFINSAHDLHAVTAISKLMNRK